LFTTGQQVGVAAGLAVLATVAGARTVHAAGSLVDGYRVSFLLATVMTLSAAALVAAKLASRHCQQQIERQRATDDGDLPTQVTEAQLRKC
jgi:hypothetical protein